MIIDHLIECQKDKNIQVWNGIDWIPSIFAEYKGKDPIQRFLSGSSTSASVGVHRMTEKVDLGETLNEVFIEIDKKENNTPPAVYNLLYPLYCQVLLDILRRFSNE